MTIPPDRKATWREMKNCKITPFALLALSIGLSLWSGCDSSDTDDDSHELEATETFSYTFSARQFGTVKLDGINGFISITGSDMATMIDISGEKKVVAGSFEDAEEHLEDIQVTIDDSGSTLTVKTEQPESSGGRNYVVNYEITIPSGKDVDVRNVNGNVELGQLSGGVKVDLTNGSIECMGSSAPARDIDLRTVNGSIDFGIAVSASASVTATVVNGQISLNNLDISNAEITPTRVSLVLGSGSVNVMLRTVNGNVFACGLM